jgi:stage II sporulation protein AA (anti-sigma F factor antagonist)
MTCSRCGLSIRLRGTALNLDRCPRCFAFAGVSVPLRRPSSFGYLIVSTQQHGSATVVTLNGKLDLASERCFEKAIWRACELGGEQLVIDLTALEFLDGIGLKALLRARRRSLEHGQELVLVKGPPNVQRMFELTDTLHLFSFDD